MVKKIEFTFEYFQQSKNKAILWLKKSVDLARWDMYEWFHKNKKDIMQWTLYRNKWHLSLLWNYNLKGCLNLYNKEERVYVDLMKEKDKSDFEYELARLESMILD